MISADRIFGCSDQDNLPSLKSIGYNSFGLPESAAETPWYGSTRLSARVFPYWSSGSRSVSQKQNVVGLVRNSVCTIVEVSLLICFFYYPVIVWMDQGRPLEKSPPGPWTSHLKSKATPLPVLQYHHKMAFRTTTNRLDTEENASAEVHQSAAVLPMQYDSLLALVDLARRAPHDLVSMCIPLFAHSAFSEVQFLNLVESRIHIQMTTIAEGGPDDDALGTLQYFSNILNRHAQQLKESTRALGRLIERSNKRPAATASETTSRYAESSSGSSSSSSGAFTPHGLLEDFEQLHVRCLELSKMCSRGMTLAMNRATIEESRRAIEQSERLKRLTLLATFFIPLSFSASLFGMNIDVLGQSEVKIWWFFVLCVPITLCAYIVYLWDLQTLRRFWAGLWRECRGMRRGVMGVRDEKEAIHKVV